MPPTRPEKPSAFSPCLLATHPQEVEERDALVQLVNAQAMEIERVKAQVNQLRRKDGTLAG